MRPMEWVSIGRLKEHEAYGVGEYGRLKEHEAYGVVEYWKTGGT